MPSINRINKGKRGEREVVKILQKAIDEVFAKDSSKPIIERNLQQSLKGGYDIIGLDWLALEVKFQESDYQEVWWKQACSQVKDNQVPVLFFRKSRQKWKVKMFGYLDVLNSNSIKVPVIIGVDDFLQWFKQKIKTVD